MEIEQNSQVVKDAHKQTREARKEREYYKGLAGMYQLTYDDDTIVSKSLILLMGVYVELKSDLLQFEIKNGRTDRVKKAQSRLNILQEQIDILNKIQTNNIALKATIKRLEETNHLQWVENCELKNRLNPTSELI